MQPLCCQSVTALTPQTAVHQEAPAEERILTTCRPQIQPLEPDLPVALSEKEGLRWKPAAFGVYFVDAHMANSQTETRSAYHSSWRKTGAQSCKVCRSSATCALCLPLSASGSFILLSKASQIHSCLWSPLCSVSGALPRLISVLCWPAEPQTHFWITGALFCGASGLTYVDSFLAHFGSTTSRRK
jgi:hypothetical protein